VHDAFDPDWSPGSEDDRFVEAELVRSRERRARAARLMVLVLLVPLAVQAAMVTMGAAARWGLLAVALPAIVVWMIVRGRRAPGGAGIH